MIQVDIECSWSFLTVLHLQPQVMDGKHQWFRLHLHAVPWGFDDDLDSYAFDVAQLDQDIGPGQSLCCKFVGCFRTYKPQVAGLCSSCMQSWICIPLDCFTAQVAKLTSRYKNKERVPSRIRVRIYFVKAICIFGKQAGCMQLHLNTPRSRKRTSHISFKFLLFPFVLFFVVFLLHDVLWTCFSALYYAPIRWKVSLGKPLLILTWPTSWATSWSPWGPLNISRVKMPNLSIMPFSQQEGGGAPSWIQSANYEFLIFLMWVAGFCSAMKLHRLRHAGTWPSSIPMCPASTGLRTYHLCVCVWERSFP